MLEEDFDKDAERAKKKATSQNQDKKLIDLKMQERRLIDKKIPTRSLSDNVQREASGKSLAVLLSMCSSMVLHSIQVCTSYLIYLEYN